MMHFNYLKILTHFSLGLMVMTLVSCVGTVEDRNPPTTKTAETNKSSISFSGIVKAEPISDSKVEVYFLPAVGDPTTLIYQIVVNNSINPIKVKGDTLTTNPSGQYIYTVSGLNVNTMYSFSVNVVDNLGNQALDNNKIYKTTFGNKTCDFEGISQVTLPAGDAGKTSIKVEWVPAIKLGAGPIDVKPTDPVNYEVHYISDVGGPNNLFIESYSGPDDFPPEIVSKDDREVTLTGLNPGTTYYVGVRCIHDAWAANSSFSGYKKEENHRILSIETNTNTGIFDFNTNGVQLKTPLAEAGRDELDIVWEAATGDFNEYRVFVVNVANDLVPDQITDDAAGIDTLLNGPNETQRDASAISHRAIGLIPYRWYQIKVVACRTSTCAQGDRIVSALQVRQLVPNLAPFQGILNIGNPVTSAALDEVYLSFSPPSMSAGYASQMELYCVYNKADPLNNNILMTPGVSTGALGNGTCDNLTASNPIPFPTTIGTLAGFSSATIQGVNTVTPTEYCFIMIPVIDDGYTVRDLANGVMKCTIPQVVPPTMVEFPGKDMACTNTGTTLPVNWVAPTGGIYENYMVFWKLKSAAGFSFDDAKAQQLAAGTANDAAVCMTDDTKYCWATKLAADITHSITNLDPGKTYQTGILSFADNAGTKIWSENNINTSSCTIELPKAKFTEWNHILALGPKKNGMVPEGNTASQFFDYPYLIETLDADGNPLEVDLVDDVNNATLDLEPVDNNINGTNALGNKFDGIFGAWNSNPTGQPRHQYSATGIIHIEWEDVTMDLGGGPFTLTTAMDNYYPGGSAAHAALTKDQRIFGYKVYRSDDNKATWKDLTIEGPSGGFQRATNVGLITASVVPMADPYRDRALSNVAPTADISLAKFTDYSVQFQAGDFNTERARIYWYKIVPVFDGKELSYDTNVVDPLQDDPNGHIIKVVLPPPNMALIHRKMANKTICGEIGRNIRRGAGHHYTCPYKGLGARSLDQPMNTATTVVDQGGDLLVDRFELGCNVTRGRIDAAGALSDASVITNAANFVGQNNSGSKFRGCYWVQGGPDAIGLPLSYGGTPGDADRYSLITHGDCIGEDTRNFAPITCPSTSTPGNRNFVYPGARGELADLSCDNAANTAYSQDYTRKNAQSEFGAVFYHINQDAHVTLSGRIPQPYMYTAGSVDRWTHRIITNQGISVNGCFVNLPSKDITGGNDWVARWLPTNQLAGDNLRYGTWTADVGPDAGSTPINILNKTMGEIYAMSEFYNSGDHSLPSAADRDLGRFNDNTPLAKVFSSNNAKLPPLRGMAQEDYHTICSQYQVEVGATNASNIYNVVDAAKPKRTLRRKEQIIASAWPAHYDNAKIVTLENGSFVDALGNRACNTVGKIVDGGNYGNGNPINSVYPSRMTNAYNPTVFSGSSFKDNTVGTGKCISRFGVQDLIGNQKEVVADRIHCYYGSDSIYLGVSGLLNSSIPYRTQGCVTRDAFGTCIESGSWYYDDSALDAWVQPSVGSGQCSAVQESGTRTGVAYTNGASMKSIFSGVFPSGVNEDMIKDKAIDHFDVSSYNDLRNGDGWFLDFGDINIAPRISLDDSLSLSNAGVSLAKFFNPVIGFPIACNGNACDDSVDNVRFTTAYLYANKTYTVPEDNELTGANGNNNFPIGNSDIFNTGISSIFVSSTASFDPINDNPLTEDATVVDNIDPTQNDLTFTGEDLYTPYPLNLTSMPARTAPNKDLRHMSDFPNQTFTLTSWTISRQEPLVFEVGGHSGTTSAGRYYMNVVGPTAQQQRSTPGFTGQSNGGRCAIMINTDY